MSVKEHLSVQNLVEAERYPDVDVGGCSCILSNICEKEFSRVEALRINEFSVRILKP
jgi:hypothetical protein